MSGEFITNGDISITTLVKRSCIWISSVVSLIEVKLDNPSISLARVRTVIKDGYLPFSCQSRPSLSLLFHRLSAAKDELRLSKHDVGWNTYMSFMRALHSALGETGAEVHVVL
jgi:hypothetical protein